MYKISFIFILGVSAFLAGCGDEKGGPPPAPPTPEVTVGRAIARDLTEWDEYVGRLVAIDDVELRARVSGYLEKTHFKDGQMVEVGDLLFTIDPRPYQAQVDRAVAQRAQAQASLALAETNLTRAESLLKTNAISSEEVDIRRSSKLAATAEVQAAEAELAAVSLDLEFTQITAPVAGRISRDLVTPGNLVSGGSGGATLLTTIRSVDPIHCYFEADESAYLKYLRLDLEGKRSSSREGTANPVELALADEKGFPHKGVMDFVENALDRNTATIQGRAIFANPDRTLTPGLFTRVRLQGSVLKGAVQIPDRAISRDQSRNFVWVLDENNTAIRHNIEPGPLIDGLRVVHSGISAGDRVVINGLQRIRPGTTVIPTEEGISPTADAHSSSSATTTGEIPTSSQTGE
ncbi:MAG: efflux RND transporter periplasmic adaptor subunit [Verrucomicrobiales bacterium]|nr:efflux RND transporter periplasmic adaptor subunit [Verrucomicrobiales bacterium]